MPSGACQSAAEAVDEEGEEVSDDVESDDVDEDALFVDDDPFESVL